MKKDLSSQSQRYQYVLNEITYGSNFNMITEYRQEESHEYNRRCRILSDANIYNLELLYDLDERLRDIFHTKLEQLLTDKQLIVYKLIAAGDTQCEAAKKLNTTQGVVAGYLRGCSAKKMDGSIVHYGGICSKIRMLLTTNKEIIEIMQQIYGLIDIDVETHLPFYHSFILCMKSKLTELLDDI